MNRTERLYALVEALRAAGPRGRTAAWLGERFEVSSRTIKRDVAALLTAGVPISSFDGRGGGYSVQRNATLPPLSFTGGEAIAIAVALAAEPNLPFRPDGSTALNKIVAAMSPSQQSELRDLAQRMWMRIPTSPPRPVAARTLDEALRQRVVTLIDYEDAVGERTVDRSIEPMVFARVDRHWYVLAWCRLREAGRWFRLDRVLNARLTRERAPDRDMVAVFGEPPEDAGPVTLEAEA
jgi:predicted DNA-binding transcriptional regulator YafY